MKFKFLAISFVLTLLLSGVASAQTGESIRKFSATIQVNTDSSVSVVEEITYDTGSQYERHGIIRSIDTQSATGKRMILSNISVTDTNGNPYAVQKEGSWDNVSLKIGDPDQTFSGERTYVIRYTASNAVSHLQDYDEIYWNATGNDWQFPIAEAHVTVVLPDATEVLQFACYVGKFGSTTGCSYDLQSTAFSAQTLAPGEGLTVAVGFPKGIVALPPQPNLTPIIFGCILVPILLFLFFFSRWQKKGRDPKGTGIIVPQYDVPDALTPMEVGVITYEKSRTKDISAELIYLATKGYIIIRQIDQTILKVIHSTDYELELIKEYGDIATEFDRKLLDSIFPSPKAGTVVKISELRDHFYLSVPNIFKLIRNAVLDNGYYKNLPKTGAGGRSVISVFLGPVLILIAAVNILNGLGLISIGTIIPMAISFVASVIIVVVFSRLMPAKTEKGVATHEYILGLKTYLQIAEKDRLQFHNAPEKKPELFEKLLPYALVLGVENSWAKEFNDLYMAPPSWYQGTTQGQFNALVFVHTISQFNTAASGTFHAPSSSGSGGGGFSGGGGGGGGGGSW